MDPATQEAFAEMATNTYFRFALLVVLAVVVTAGFMLLKGYMETQNKRNSTRW